MPFALDVSVAVWITEILGRDVQNTIVKHIQNIDTGKAAARVTGVGHLDVSEKLDPILNRLAIKLTICHNLTCIPKKFMIYYLLLRLHRILQKNHKS
jgi:hypothetical protein